MPGFLRPRPALLLAGAALAAWVLSAPRARAAGASDLRSATLEAIHLLENPQDLRTPGPCGELGAYQFRESTWRRYTDEPFSRAVDRSASDLVARRHYDWLRGRLEANGIPVTPYTIALAWNGGITSEIRGRSPAAARDYAARAANLAGEMLGSGAVAFSAN